LMKVWQIDRQPRGRDREREKEILSGGEVQREINGGACLVRVGSI